MFVSPAMQVTKTGSRSGVNIKVYSLILLTYTTANIGIQLSSSEDGWFPDIHEIYTQGL